MDIHNGYLDKQQQHRCSNQTMHILVVREENIKIFMIINIRRDNPKQYGQIIIIIECNAKNTINKNPMLDLFDIDGNRQHDEALESGPK